MTRQPFVELPERMVLRLRLEEAGATLATLPGGDGLQRFRSNMPEPVREAIEAYGWTGAKVRPARPGAAQISRMDEALAWVSLIPAAKPSANPRSFDGGAVLRRLVQCRLLVDPVSWQQSPNTPRYVFTWTKLGALMGMDPRAVKRYHGMALGQIWDALVEADTSV